MVSCQAFHSICTIFRLENLKTHDFITKCSGFSSCLALPIVYHYPYSSGPNILAGNICIQDANCTDEFVFIILRLRINSIFFFFKVHLPRLSRARMGVIVGLDKPQDSALPTYNSTNRINPKHECNLCKARVSIRAFQHPSLLS
jgi:hypothetical protein